MIPTSKRALFERAFAIYNRNLLAQLNDYEELVAPYRRRQKKRKDSIAKEDARMPMRNASDDVASG
jgi:hypothetical protein